MPRSTSTVTMAPPIGFYFEHIKARSECQQGPFCALQLELHRCFIYILSFRNTSGSCTRVARVFIGATFTIGILTLIEVGNRGPPLDHPIDGRRSSTLSQLFHVFEVGHIAAASWSNAVTAPTFEFYINKVGNRSREDRHLCNLPQRATVHHALFHMCAKFRISAPGVLSFLTAVQTTGRRLHWATGSRQVVLGVFDPHGIIIAHYLQFLPKFLNFPVLMSIWL